MTALIAVVAGLAVVGVPTGLTFPEEAAIRFRLSTALWSEGHREMALEHAEQVARLTPTWAPGQLWRARVRRALGLPDDETRGALEAALRHGPADASAVSELAELMDEGGKPKAAEKLYKRAVEIAPQIARPRRRLGVMAQERGDLAEAIVHLQAAVLADPSDAITHTLLADTFERLGRVDEAEAALEALIQIAPANPFSWSRKADFLRRHGRDKDARKASRIADKLWKESAGPRRRMRPLKPSKR